MDKAEKALKFVEHIEEHLKDEPLGYGEYYKAVMCKICGKTIDEIAEE